MQELILEEKTTLSPVMKEIYRRLRTNLEFTGIENKVICLTSCMENDGKSSVSFNLAKILAENDKRVLFIDADMRNSVLMNRTGIPDDLKGLSHYLAGKNAASEVIYATNYKNFYVIPTGRFPKNPTELLNKPAYEVLIEGMKQTFDYVIIDTPPLGSVVDAALIAKTADASVLVMQCAPEKVKGEDGLPIPPYRVYNIGNNSPENLLDFVDILQQELIRAGVLPEDYDFEAHKKLVPMQPGDVPVTYADTSALERDFGFKPSTSLREGLRRFAEWYKEFYL